MALDSIGLLSLEWYSVFRLGYGVLLVALALRHSGFILEGIWDVIVAELWIQRHDNILQRHDNILEESKKFLVGIHIELTLPFLSNCELKIGYRDKAVLEV